MLRSRLTLRLNIHKFLVNVKPWAMGFPRIQVTVPHNQRLRITLMQILQQGFESPLLRLYSGVTRSLAVSSKASDVCHTDGMGVVVLAVGTDLLFWSPHLNTAVNRNDIVVSASAPSEGTMIAVDVRHPKGTARPVGGAVHDNKSNLSHRNFNFLIFQSHDKVVIAPPAAPVITNSMNRSTYSAIVFQLTFILVVFK